MSHICVELGALGDVAVPAHKKTHPLFRALPDEKYESPKTVLLCEMQRIGSVSKSEDIALLQHPIMACKLVKRLPLKKKVRGEAKIMQAVTSAH